MRRKPMLPRAKAAPKHRRTFIREWREHRDMDQAEVTALIEELTGASFSISQLSRKENGRSPVNQNDIQILSDIYKCTTIDLLSRKPDENEHPMAIFESLSDEEKTRATLFMISLRNTSPTKAE